MLMTMAKGEYVFDGSMMVYVDGADDDDANADYDGDGEKFVVGDDLMV